MPEIIMLVGAPCSGKTTWRQQNCPDYRLIDTDSYIEQRAQELGTTYGVVFDSEIRAAEADMQQRLRMAVACGANIVWDQTNMTRRARQRKLSQIPQFYRRAAVVFQVDLGELLRRNQQRARDTGKVIPTRVIHSMLDNFEMPTEDEGYDRGVVQVSEP
jgi:predicted kinase